LPVKPDHQARASATVRTSAHLAHQAQAVNQAQTERLALTDSLASLASLVTQPQFQPIAMGNADFARKDQRDHPAHQEMAAHPDHLEVLEVQADRANQVNPDRQDHPVHQDHRVQTAKPDRREPRVRMAKAAARDQLDPKAQLARPVHPDQVVRQDHQARTASPATTESVAIQDQRAHQDKPDSPVKEARRDHLDRTPSTARARSAAVARSHTRRRSTKPPRRTEDSALPLTYQSLPSSLISSALLYLLCHHRHTRAKMSST